MNHPPKSETPGRGFPHRRAGALILLLVNFFGIHHSVAREFRPDRIPNGAVNSCNTCHSDGGGTARNPFGEAVESAIGGTSADVAFWEPSLAGQDSDGDGYTNGQELGDPSGFWPNQAARPGATSPGDPNSFPRSPVFSSSPVTSATVGVAYSYQAMAAEPNGLPVAYGKAGGPGWLSVSSNGLVSGTPTDGGESVTVRIRVFVNGLSSLSADQVYTLNVVGGNTAPSFTSTPVTTAIIGQPYSYQATATDPDGNAVAYAKTAGPNWLNVSSAGLASGTPPAGSAGSVQVTLRATDNASSPLSADQTFALVVSEPVISFAVWQAQNFTLPAENAIAAPDQDPDDDDLSNLVEYGLKTPPQQATATRLMSNRAFNGSGQLQFFQIVRDDDPKLSITWEVGSALPLGSPAGISAVITDPTAGDGLKTWTFTDTVSRNNAGARYGRLRFEILP